MSGELTVTVKYGKGYEESWAVFRGEPGTVRKHIGDYFGLTEDVTQGMTLHEVVSMATKVAHGTATMARVLGAEPIADKAPTTPTQPASWGAVDKPAEEVHPHAGLIDALQNAATAEDLKGLWVRNKDAFTNEDVLAAYKERGAALKASA